MIKSKIYITRRETNNLTKSKKLNCIDIINQKKARTLVKLNLLRRTWKCVCNS